MSIDVVHKCKEFINGLPDDAKRAIAIDEKFPFCVCESCSIGQNSRGPVGDSETLYRLIVSPGDIDLATGHVFTDSLKKASENGLSVFRESATDQDVHNLVVDRLTIKSRGAPRIVMGLLSARAVDVRALKNVENHRAFCVYDETVPRRFDTMLPHVRAHVSIYQRVPAPGKNDRKLEIEKDRSKLHRVMVATRVEIEAFRNGLLLELNAKSLAGEFNLG